MYRYANTIMSPPRKINPMEDPKDFIDRREEMKVLEKHMNSVTEGEGKIVLLKGEAGVGKSILAEAFADKCSKQGFEVLIGRCLYYESTDPYIPFIEALGDYVMDKEVQPEDTSGSMSVAGMPMSLIGAGLEEEEEIADISISDKRELMFDKVTSVVINRSKDNPILLFIDDLQWIDEASAQLLHHLARHTSDDRVLLLGAYRPEELVTGDSEYPLDKVLDRMREERLVDMVDIKRLSFKSASEMIKKRLHSKELPQSFLMLIYRVTEGNPYYIVEMLNSMVDEGVIDPYSYTWDPEKDLANVTVPASIKDVTTRRIENLSNDGKKVLMYASVIGTEFDFEVLENSIKMDVIELLDIMDDLDAHGLIHEKEGEGEEIYRFGHIQTRAAIYDNMGRSRKRVLHLQIANTIEEVYSDRIEEYYYTLSRHYYEGKDYDKAYEYSNKAGEMAVQSYATESALEYYDRALRSLKKSKEIDEKDKKEEAILKQIGDLSYDTSDWEISKDSFEKLVDMAKERDDRDLEEGALRRVGHIYREIQKYEEAKEYFERSLEIAKDEDNEEGIADANRGLGYLHWRSGKFDDAIEHYESAVEVAKDMDNQRILALTYIEMANLYSNRGDKELAIQYYKRSLPTLIKHKSYRELARAYNNIGDSYMKMEEWDKAIEYFEKCTENAEKIGNKMYLGWSYFNRAEALACRGDPEEAMRYAERAEKLMKHLNDKIGLAATYKAMGISEVKFGNLKEALGYFEKALETIKELDIPFEESEIKYWFGHVYKEMGDKEKAMSFYTDAKSILDSIGAGTFIEKIDNEMQSLGD